MVEGIVGLMGQGKTVLATARGLEALKAGRRVVANYRITGAEYAANWDDILEATTPKIDAEGRPARSDALVIIDEANLWCPSRFWAKLDPRLLYSWSQSRKFGLDILWTAQHEARVDTALREITYQIWLSRRFGKRLFWYRAYMPEEARKEKRHRLETKWLLGSKAIYDSYNTYEVIDLGRQLLSDIERRPDYRGPEDQRQPVEEHWLQPALDKRFGKKRKTAAVVVR